MSDFDKAMKEIIVEQRTKIKELEDENKALHTLLNEYISELCKNEKPGLLMDAVGRKLLLDLAMKVDK